MENIQLTKLDLEKQREILTWLPKRIIDVHTHTGIQEHHFPLSTERKKSSFAASLSEQLGYESRESLLSTYQQLFPGISVRYASFPFPFREVDTVKANDYVMQSDFPFVLVKPDETQREIRGLLRNPRVAGVKVYYDFVNKPYSDIEINDFVNSFTMEELNETGKVLMLHVPRSSLADKVNSEQTLYLSEQYPNAKIILAHMGRCQTEEQAKKAFYLFVNRKNIYLDTSTVSNSRVLVEGLKVFGSRKVLYGSDSPLSKVRARIMETNASFGVGFITPDIYPWTWEEAREWYLKNKPEISFLGYHDLLALKESTNLLGLSREDLEDIFLSNAERIFSN